MKSVVYKKKMRYSLVEELQELQELRKSGYSDKEIVKIMTNRWRLDCEKK